MTNDVARVLVVDDDTFMRAALRRVFINAGILVETFASAQDLLSYADLCSPGVLLLDVKMPGMSGLELQTVLRERGVVLPVIFLTGSGAIPMAVEAMRNGAVDFLEKPFDNGMLVDRVRWCFDRCATSAAQIASIAHPDHARRVGTLTPREREVYERMTTGKTSKIIARELGCSFRTVEIHRTRVMSKMAASNLADLVRMSLTAEKAA
jgi:two-component system response regulator FixJ